MANFKFTRQEIATHDVLFSNHQFINVVGYVMFLDTDRNIVQMNLADPS